MLEEEEEEEEEEEKDKEEEYDHDKDVDDYQEELKRDVPRQQRLEDAFPLSTDIQAEEWDEDELRLLIAPSRSRGRRRRLGETRGVFAEKMTRQRRDVKDPSKSRRRSRKRRDQEDRLETASATAVVELLTKELRE